MRSRETACWHRDYARDIKKDYQQQLRDLDTDFKLQQVDLRAERQAEMAIAQSELQQTMMQLMMNAQSVDNDDAMEKLRADIAAHNQRVFEIKRQAAITEQEEFVANERRKSDLLAERDQLALDEAESLGLRDRYTPIMASAIGGELTKQEQRWNEREEKEVERLHKTNARLWGEFVYGKELREWELANKQEDFRLKWEKEAELHALNGEQSFYNLIFAQPQDGKEVDQAEMTRKITELSKQTQLINIKYKKIRDKQRIERREQKRAITQR